VVCTVPQCTLRDSSGTLKIWRRHQLIRWGRGGGGHRATNSPFPKAASQELWLLPSPSTQGRESLPLSLAPQKLSLSTVCISVSCILSFSIPCILSHPSFLLLSVTCIVTRVSPFRLKNFFAYKRNKANLDPFHMCFTISL
jgi:hypothetical protein